MKLILDPVSVAINKAIEEAARNGRTPLRIELTETEYYDLREEFRKELWWVSYSARVSEIARYRDIPVVKV